MSERQSLNNNLIDRYKKQHVGSAYDAKRAGIDHVNPIPDVNLETKYRKNSSIFVKNLDERGYTDFYIKW